MPEDYWRIQWARWMHLAFICRYGHQDVYRVLGRDPAIQPLTALERALFERALFVTVEAEFSSKAGGYDHRGE